MLRSVGIVEHLHRTVPIVSGVSKRLKYGREIGISETRAVAAGVVEVDVGHIVLMLVNGRGCVQTLAEGRPHVDDHAEIRMIDLPDHPGGLGGGVDEIGLGAVQGLEADGHPVFLRRGQAFHVCLTGPFPGRLVGLVRQHVALLRRPGHHDPAPDVTAEFDQIAEIQPGAVPDAVVGVVQVKAFRTEQEPVEPRDLQSEFRCVVSDRLPCVRTDLVHRRSHRKRGDLHAVVADFRGGAEDLPEGHVPEHLVAEGELHTGSSASCVFLVASLPVAAYSFLRSWGRVRQTRKRLRSTLRKRRLMRCQDATSPLSRWMSTHTA